MRRDQTAFLEFVEAEHAYILALCRVEADRRKVVSNEKRDARAMAAAEELGLLDENGNFKDVTNDVRKA